MFTQSARYFLRHGLGKAALAWVIAVALISPRQANAWGNTGHEAVAYVAWQQMNPVVRNRVIELLKLVPTLHNPANTKSIPGYAEWMADLPAGLSQDQQNLYLFMRAATWADTIKHQWLKDSDTPPPDRTTEVHIGFTDTESHGYWHFVDKALSSDGSPLPETPVPNAATQITALRQTIASEENDTLKSYDLIWLEHLVGDVHQPLHGAVRYFAGDGDEGGNLVKIKMAKTLQKKFEGTQSKSYPRELHAFWDDLPGEGQPAPALPDALNFAKNLESAPEAATADIDPSNWSAESFALAEKDAYTLPIGDGLHPSSGSAYMITQAYYAAAIQDAKDRIAIAGSRLAKLLNDNLR